MKQAFDNPGGPLFELDDDDINKGLSASHTSERLRMILPIHRSQDAEVQRIVNFVQPGTYIRPHRHPLPHATESIIVLKGRIHFLIFEDDGSLKYDKVLSSKPIPGIIDIEPLVWHSFWVLEEDTILFECKKGPYDATADKEFAEWSPSEGSPEAAGWIRKFI